MFSIRAIALLLTLFACSIRSQATTYYLSSSSGDDSRTALQAQNPATPWKSIQKLNSFFASLQPGDSVLFKRGDTFYGSISVEKSGSASAPIVLSAYGTGAKPVITGLTPLTGWTSKGGGIYETTTTLPNASLMMVLFNGRPQPMGRYPNTDQPNKGYLTFEGASDGLSLTDNELPATPNWTGAEVVVRSNHWTLNKATIGSHLGTKIVFANPMERSAANYGYFIQNDIRTLDQVGEWYYNPLTKKLSVFFGSLSPAQISVQAATLENLLHSYNVSYVTVENLSFQGSNADVVDITSGAGMTVRACELFYAGRDAIDVMGSPTLPRIENCVIAHTNSTAIDISGYTINSVIRGNTIRNTGLFEGMCESGNKSSIAIHAKSHGHSIEGNTIDSTGYAVIRFTGNDIVVKNNVITNFTLIKDDGGAITVNNPGDSEGINRRITGNIILNGPGALDGTDRAWVASSGIYLDDKVDGVEISGNTIAGCVKTGIYVHNTSRVTLRGNTLYNNSTQLTLTHDGLAPDHPIRNLNIKDNILFSRQEKQSILRAKSIKDDLTLMGTIDSNYHCRPVEENMTISTSYVTSSGTGVGNIYELEGWRDRFGYDKGSRKTARQLPCYTIKALLGTNKFANGSFTSDISGLKTSPSGIGSWVSAKLDGGTFQGTVSPSAGQSEVQLMVGALSATKNYVLRFSVQSTKDTVFNLVIYGGSTKLTETRSFKVGTQRREYEFFFPLPLGTTIDGKVFINTKAKDLRFWLDNIVMQEADATLQDPDKQIRFEYNGTATTKTVTLDAAYVDVKGKTYTQSITLQPYTSVILLKDTTTAAVNQAPSVSLTSPVSGATFTTPASVSLTATAADSDGTIEKVEFFSGTTLLGNATQAPYSFVWNNVAAGSYSLSAKATDNNGLTTLSKSINVSFQNCSATGSILREYWSNVTGTTVSAIPLSVTPSATSQLTSFEAPSNDGSSYGQRVRGYICAPVTGQYTFYIASDDNSELWLSSSDDPAAKTKIAELSNWTAAREWTKYASQKSVTISLQAGTKYYIEALHKEGSGGDNLAVGWTTPGSTSIVVIPGNVLSPFVPTVTTSCSATGSILREYWSNVTGTTVSAIPLSVTPSATSQLTSFEAPSNDGSSYGQRVRGYICAPVTGQYTFYIASDDNSELWLSSSDDPAAKTKIAELSNWTAAREWTKYASQKSVTISLQAGTKYYIEALHKEGSGGDNLAVGWTTPGSTSIVVIPGNVLSPFVPGVQSTKSLVRTSDIGEAVKEPTTSQPLSLNPYPNPSNNYFNLSIEGNVEQPISLQIFDFSGRLIEGKNGLTGKSTIQIGHQLPRGMYIIQIVQGTRKAKTKITKL